MRNNGGGHLNHSAFWLMMKKNGGGRPTGELAAAIDKDFGSFDKFKTAFADAAMKVFGSGWAWLGIEGQTQRARQDPQNRVHAQPGPVDHHHGELSCLGIDVWGHAYYLKYHNLRADYIAAFFNVIDWDKVAGDYKG